MTIKMADDAVSVVSDIPDRFRSRYEKITELFVGQFGKPPTFYARAPGRVNLIGEHIDYCGYGVLPMAIEQDIVIAVSTNAESKIKLANTNPNFSPFEVDTKNYTISRTNPEWHNYFLCGYKGLTEHLGVTEPVGINCMVDGTVPRSAGLSSSSALVCCAALATMHANGHSTGKREMADMCASCERYIGTQGGGMDQAISFMAQPGTAKKIDFNPLREVNVRLPDDVTFVISNCCVEKNKAASSEFNTRVVECRLASQIIAKSKSLEWWDIKRLADLQGSLKVKVTSMATVVEEVLHREAYSKQEVCNILGVSEDELAGTSLSPNTLDVQSFKLYDRAMHVYGEAERVDRFAEICDTTMDIKTLGSLMIDSHTSCRDVYECSCPELDRLVDICGQSGALGSRLTGAGWGGCAVSMVPTNQLAEFLENVKVTYYTGDLAAIVNDALFATQPGAGAAIYE